MPHQSALDFGSARITLVSALAWRVLAELFRRYRDLYDLRVLQVHPGISLRGALYLAVPTGLGEASPCLSLHIGGPAGTYSVLRRIDGQPSDSALTTSVPFAWPMLTGDPSRVVDEIAEALGLPGRGGHVAHSHPTTLVVRAIAGLMERLTFRRTCWRTTAAFCDNSEVGPMVADWAMTLGASKQMINDAVSGRDATAAAILSRYVLLHRCAADEICLRLDELKGPAWAFCMKTGVATQLTSNGSGQTIKIPQRYEELRRQLDAVLNELCLALA